MQDECSSRIYHKKSLLLFTLQNTFTPSNNKYENLYGYIQFLYPCRVQRRYYEYVIVTLKEMTSLQQRLQVASEGRKLTNSNYNKLLNKTVNSTMSCDYCC